MWFVISFSAPLSSCSSAEQSVSHSKKPFMNFLKRSPFHELQRMLQQWVLSMGYSPSAVDRSYEGSSPWATFPDRKLIPDLGLHRLKILHGVSTWSRMGSSMDCSVDICSSVDFHDMVLSLLLGKLLQQLEHLLPLILPWHWCLQGSHIFSLLSPSSCSATDFLKSLSFLS